MADLIIRPILTEKITAMQDQRQYAFEVPTLANKIEIGKAVEKRFNVKVTSVRTMRVHGKSKVQLTRRGRFDGRTRTWKKALVTLKDGDKIDLFTTTT
ncbi:MAG: 50S ribosomal protein L23 [Ignavibacteria bacterium GWA2_55_11]|uniref:Large ribosomal subunit protein uL23 n=1 Tax=uncultured Ignavibacteria bacterium Rifle_16ft_4_minimus_16666 TaxID=1665099 RepID=A0A0H4T194_9BACT|nr:50S ribosomal protein L23 [uncultured Ignavibacteria bacterium Rifle_16ft_4_minimus_16666]OGU32651.1 MAG: 50S ribosomal protein L23 [Ignavibacteria bacterium GWA2_55_11]OGU43462.1 MAG: 50S ribosomal protein L23 [Ignavibacteria bacterium GWC2_56_12]OGU64994.1 MAG: 50S ribosomal protein L23 [Ignavibacteria bacterium RIFCSPHIGHO2_02_FULL_56_12]OGU71876.1 MAG: 50S ribosomal protein L23 [Ignavibacteria bacterium RIFCSPLOWO2_12_FULL_56_21]OGU74643.1 MAG: 50S ribosomal protein L23 [Ignavibacteria 